MKRGLFFGTIVTLIVVLGIWFVVATVYNQAPATAKATETITMLVFNVTNTSNSSQTFTSITIANAGNATVGNLTNITVSNGTWVKSNTTLSSLPVTITISEEVTAEQNYTINFTLSENATYGVGLQANVTATSIGTNVNHSLVPFNSTETLVTESTAPTATAACSPSDVYLAEAFPCTCTGADSGAAASGVASSTGSSTAPEGITTPLTIGTFTYTCTVTDVAGNSATDTAKYNVLNVGGGSPAPIIPSTKQSHSFSKVTPGVASIAKDFNPEIGVKQIEISVDNEAQNVKITVTKYDSKPVVVSVAKSGSVYQYVQIEGQNLGTSLDTATVQFRVEKSWVSSNGLNRDGVSVYRFDESSQRWNELQTTSSGEDSTHYYYDVELSSFSFFAISEKTLAPGEGVTAEGEEPAPEPEGGISVWLWILIALVVLIVIWWQVGKRR